MASHIIWFSFNEFHPKPNRIINIRFFFINNLLICPFWENFWRIENNSHRQNIQLSTKGKSFHFKQWSNPSDWHSLEMLEWKSFEFKKFRTACLPFFSYRFFCKRFFFPVEKNWLVYLLCDNHEFFHFSTFPIFC